jgi:hypothetical protein
MSKGKGNFQVHLVLYEVTNEGSENEVWELEDQELLCAFEDYEDTLDWMGIIGLQARSVLQVLGANRKYIRGEVGRRLQDEGFRIVESHCNPCATGRRYKIRIVKLDMSSECLWKDKPEVELTEDDYSLIENIIERLVPVNSLSYYEGYPHSCVAIWRM